MAVKTRVFWLPGSSTNPNLPKLQPVGIKDSFNRPNSTTTLGTTDNGVPWVTQGVWGIRSGKAYCVSGTGTLAATAEANAADIKLTVTIGGIEDYAGIGFRIIDDANRLFVNWLGSNLRLYKRVGGTSTLVVSVTGGAPVAGDAITVIAIGTTITVQKNGVTLLTQTVTENATGTRCSLMAGTAGGVADFDSIECVPL